jgi:23S rRNA m(5)U-1939 methyltransferase (EC 2.1.1.-)
MHATGEPLTLKVEKLLWRGRGLARLESGQVVMIEPACCRERPSACV